MSLLIDLLSFLIINYRNQLAKFKVAIPKLTTIIIELLHFLTRMTTSIMMMYDVAWVSCTWTEQSTCQLKARLWSFTSYP